MFTKEILRILKKYIASKFTRNTIKIVNKITEPSEKIKKIVFRAIARNETVRTTPLSYIEYIVYYSESDITSHYNMWNPIFAEHAETYVSIIRNYASWWRYSEEPHVYPVSSIHQIEYLMKRMPKLKAIFYPSNNGVNMQAIRHNNLTHVFIGHGDSNKASSANKVFRLYDEIWIAGQAHSDRFKHVKGDYSSLKFRIIGQPWMRSWLSRLPKYSQQDRNQWAYFPTWRGYYQSTNYSSLDLMSDISNAAQNCLGNESAGFLKLHPWSSDNDVHAAHQLIAEKQRTLATTQSQKLNNDSIETGINLPDKTIPICDILEKPLRFVICDLSAAITECLYINVPIFLYHSKETASVTKKFKKQNDFCYLFHNLDELNILLERVITNNDDFLKEKRQKALNYFVDIEKTKTNSFQKELRNLPLLK